MLRYLDDARDTATVLVYLYYITKFKL